MSSGAQDDPALSAEELRDAAANPGLNEDMALALLARRDLPHRAVEALAANPAIMKHRRVALEVVKHPRAPRHVSLPLLRRLFTFDLVQVAMTPVVPADLKVAAEETLISRLETISLGERIALARRGTNRLAGVLLLDAETRVADAALQNPYLAEASVVRALMKDEASSRLCEMIARHAKWSLRSDVQIALLQNGRLSNRWLGIFVHGLPTPALERVLEAGRVEFRVRAAIVEELQTRPSAQVTTDFEDSSAS